MSRAINFYIYIEMRVAFKQSGCEHLQHQIHIQFASKTEKRLRANEVNLFPVIKFLLCR